MSTAASDAGPFSGRFDARVFVAIFVPAVFLLIIILAMLVFLVYREPSYYENYDADDDADPYEASTSKFQVLSRAPISYA